MNEKEGMNKWKFEEYIKNIIATLYPDAADVPDEHVLFKADKGHKSTDLMAYLLVRGFYFIPCLPIQMELLIWELKSVFHGNLKQLTRGYAAHQHAVPSGADTVDLLLFGGSFLYDEPNIGKLLMKNIIRMHFTLQAIKIR
jgi:hypothetical protein